MARDNSPKERQKKHLERTLNRRASYDRILIVSEGSKTEPNYFSEIRSAHRLNTANVAVHPSALGTAPMQVVQYAQTLFEKGDRHKSIQPRAFEQVYAVFDRDEHDSYSTALRLAESLDCKLKNDARQPIRFRAIASVPSFEIWLLLHFEDIHAPLHRDEVLSRLRQHLPGYEKGARSAFASTQIHLDAATRRAQALARKFTADTAPEPYTAIVELVSLLVTLGT
ncbi:RloB family protein [Variovorax sp. J22R133]|uniref:RloB family protein n=1 Tax=Variovorax brevis TaxID=3053503 RepID=UPI002574D798|nr:RloB family protein [Variovorax sp. J22R133]MDM0115840.1 RloB family protein [Variovorax sp. J22R133]